MNRLLLAIITVLFPLISSAQGYNSKGGSHRGYQTPYTQQEQQPSHWSGSGIAIGSKVLATNNHVVDGATHLFVYFPESKAKYSAEVIGVDATNDLAVVKITDSAFAGFPSIRYGFKQVVEDVGTEVFVLGYPRVDTMGEEVKLTTGVVSSRSGFQGNQSQYQVSAPVQPGNSGGPLFNDRGELIGIVSAKHTDGAENVSYAVKLSYLNDLVARTGESISLDKVSQISAQKLSEQCKAVIPCTVMVIADNEREASATPRQHYSAYGNAGTYPIRINNPQVGSSNSENLKIVGIEMNKDYTAIYCTICSNPNLTNQWYRISNTAYLSDSATGKHYGLKSVEGIAVAPKKTSLPDGYQADFVLYFAPLPASVASFDICEPGGWWIKGVRVR